MSKAPEYPADTNPDPITHAPGAHPVGTGIGAVAGGAAAGAVVGSVLGPVGTAVGAIVGGVAGGLLGKEVAEHVHPTHDHESLARKTADPDRSDFRPSPGDSHPQNRGGFVGESELNDAKAWEPAIPAVETLDNQSPGIIAVAVADAPRTDAAVITHGMIETRAYFMYLSGTAGQDADWFRAEQELSTS